MLLKQIIFLRERIDRIIFAMVEAHSVTFPVFSLLLSALWAYPIGIQEERPHQHKAEATF